MEAVRRPDKGMRAFLVGAAFVIVVAGLKAASSVLVPVLAAALVAVLFIPPMNWLQRRRVPDWAAVLLVFIAVLALFAGFSIGVGHSLADFKANLDIYERGLEAQFGESLQAARAWLLANAGVSLDTQSLLRGFDAGTALQTFGNAASALADLLSNALFVLLTVAFILAEAAGFPRKLEEAFGGGAALAGRSRDAVASVRSYVRIKLVVSVATGIAAMLLLALCDVDYVLLWGALAFVLNFIPTVGSLVAAVPPVLLALVQHGWERMLVVLIGYAAINMVLGNVIEPRMMGRRLGLSSLVVWLSLVFWGYVLGPIGMLLSVPLTMIVKILLERSDDLRWVAVLLGPGGEGLPQGAPTTAERQPADASTPPAP